MREGGSAPRWGSYGKSSGDISDVLEIPVRARWQPASMFTVEQLGVKPRSAAVAIAIRVIEQ